MKFSNRCDEDARVEKTFIHGVDDNTSFDATRITIMTIITREFSEPALNLYVGPEQTIFGGPRLLVFFFFLF